MKLRNNLTKIDKREFLKLLRKGAENNADAYGIFARDYIKKEGVSFVKRKLSNISEIIDDLPQTPFLVGHNRLATQGSAKDNKNNHPFETDDWVVVHNGIIHNDNELKKRYKLDYDEQTDSAIIIHMLEYFKHDDEVDIIKDVAEMLEGSFSVVVYSKKTGNLYYFKEGGTSFYFGLIEKGTDTIILGSTSEDNIEECYQGNRMIFPVCRYDNKSIVEAEKGLIYRITKEKGIEIVRDFEPTTYWGFYGDKYENSSKKSRWFDWAGDYPDLDSVIRIFIEDIEVLYGETIEIDENFEEGYIWFRIDEKYVQNIIEEYSFGNATPKGIKFNVRDIYDNCARKFGLLKDSDEWYIPHEDDLKEDIIAYNKKVSREIIESKIVEEQDRIERENKKAFNEVFKEGYDVKN